MKKIILLIVLAFSLNINAQVKDSIKVDSFQKTDEVLAEVVKKALVVAEKTGNFVIEQTPLVLQEFYRWHICSYILMILIFVIAQILISRVNRLFSYKNESELPKTNKRNYTLKKDGRWYYSDYSDGHSEAYGIASVAKILSWLTYIGVFINLYQLVFILVAPKLYLIEYFIK